MRRFTQDWQTTPLRVMVNNVRRRRSWFMENATPRQFANLALAAAEFGLKRERMHAWPVLVKVDISPACNLKCTFCVHAEPSGPSADLLQQQVFGGRKPMAVSQFADLVEEIGGKSMAVSLYYLGDPLVHPRLDEMCGIARRAGLNVHLSSNFSFNLSDDRLSSLLTSGLTHLTVCVDGLTQETYGRTRVGGRVDVVLDNLDRLLRLRRQLGRAYPRVEVQFIKFQHNQHELSEAERWCGERGVDQFTDFWGNLHNYADVAPDRYTVFGPRSNARVPKCAWPHFALQVKYTGDVIPCCYYRVTDQYRPNQDSRGVGNIFENGVWSVWNSTAYRELRRYVSNPERVLTEQGLRQTFCDGCPVISVTDVATRERTADKHTWDELYVLDNGRVSRRS